MDFLFILFKILPLKSTFEYFDKEKLARSIWKDEYNPLIHDKLIYTSLSRLRKLIEPQEDQGKYIIRGKDGYAFNKNVKTRFYRENGPDLAATFASLDLSSPV